MILRTLLTASLLISFCAEAKPRDLTERTHRGPPQVAIDACEGLTEGAACTFTGRRDDSLTGVCFTPPRAEEKLLACRPEGAPPHKREREQD